VPQKRKPWIRKSQSQKSKGVPQKKRKSFTQKSQLAGKTKKSNVRTYAETTDEEEA
jgi:hypothetical protein